MPRPASPYCKVPGCGQPRHAYPNGDRASFCDEHLYLRNRRQRDGLPAASGGVRQLLAYMVECKKAGVDWVPLGWPTVGGRTIQAALDRDWIFQSDGVDGVRYKLTSRGEDVHLRYQGVRSRRDQICPSCGERERHIRSSGTRDAYCLECLRAVSRRKAARRRNAPHNPRPCPKCRQSDVHVYSSGRAANYCFECESERIRENTRKRRAAELERAHRGEIAPCARCGERPRVVTTNSVNHYCAECRTQYNRQNRARRLAARLPRINP